MQTKILVQNRQKLLVLLTNDQHLYAHRETQEWWWCSILNLESFLFVEFHLIVYYSQMRIIRYFCIRHEFLWHHPSMFYLCIRVSRASHVHVSYLYACWYSMQSDGICISTIFRTSVHTNHLMVCIRRLANRTQILMMNKWNKWLHGKPYKDYPLWLRPTSSFSNWKTCEKFCIDSK